MVAICSIIRQGVPMQRRQTKTRKKATPQQTEPGSGIASGSVGPAGQEPSGFYWDRLKAAKTLAELSALDKELAAHRYSADGQIRQALIARRDEIGSRRRAGNSESEG